MLMIRAQTAPVFFALVCVAATRLSAAAASASHGGAAKAVRCEASTATPLGAGGEGFWNTVYSVPEFEGIHTLIISTANPASAEAELTTMLWKAGGNKLGGSDPARPWGQPFQLPSRAFQFPPNQPTCLYRGTWDVVPAKLAVVIKKLIGTGAVELYARQSNKLSFDRAEAARKLAMLDGERGALDAESASIPSVLGLVDAERGSLRALLDRYDSFRRIARLDACIKRE